MMTEAMFTNAYQAAVRKVVSNSRDIGAAFPQAVSEETGLYSREDVSYWTGGFWGGLLWLAYRACGETQLFELACEIEQEQDAALAEFMKLHHDVGFMWLPTAVFHHRLTGCSASRIRGLKAAAVLASRFHLNGRYLRAWNEEQRPDSSGLTIVDSLMNVPLLYWASRVTGDPGFRQIAEAHTDTVLKAFVRENYTVPHITKIDVESGRVIGPVQGQGKDVNSAWSRGQAWAVYGFAAGYRETGKTVYLETACRMAERFYESLPEDKIPWWDFCSEEKDRYAKDSSAACVAASGMLELAGLMTEKRNKERMEGRAREILEALITHCACFDGENQGIIKYGTVNYIHRRYVNVPIIYGDFYFLEALGKLNGEAGAF